MPYEKNSSTDMSTWDFLTGVVPFQIKMSQSAEVACQAQARNPYLNESSAKII